jgi:hypothetical protein
MHRIRELVLCLGLVSGVSFGGDLVRYALAQNAEEDLSLDFVKSQLARVRAGTPAAEAVSNRELEDESARLLAEEAALLSQLEGRARAADARVSAAQKAGFETHTAQEATRASADLNQAIAALGPLAVSPSKTQEILEVRASVAEIAPTIVSPGKALPSAGMAVAPSAVAPTDPVESMLAAVQAPPVSKSSIEQARAMNPDSRTSAASATELSALRKANAELRRQLEAHQRKLRDATNELNESRNRLMIAETEVERLSSFLEQRNHSTLVRVAPEVARAQQRRQYNAPVTAAKAPEAPAAANIGKSQLSSSPATPSDMLVGTVHVSKAHLRSGPGKDNSPLMSVSKGTRLVIETRQGGWYRVITPTGTRAWVASEVLSFGPNGNVAPSRTLQIRGVEG